MGGLDCLGLRCHVRWALDMNEREISYVWTDGCNSASQQRQMRRERAIDVALTLHGLLAVNWCDVSTQLANVIETIISLQWLGYSCI